MAVDNENDDQEQQTASSNGTESTQELMDIVRDKQTRDAAWHEYHGYDEAYERANAERVATGQIAVERYPEATLVAQIRIDEGTGKALSGHDYNPEAQSHKDSEAEFSSYVESTSPEERLVIYEGGDGHFSDRDSAIRDRADGGLVMFLADQAGTERTSGDPTPKEEAADLINHGVSPDEVALFTTLRAIGAKLIREPDQTIDPGGDIYAQLAQGGMEGFREYSEDEKREIEATPEVRDELLRHMATEGAQVAREKFNPVLAELGLPQFEVGADGALSIPAGSGTQLVEATGPSGSGRLNDIAKIDIESRDRHLFDTIADAVRSGKRPFVMFGGSHVVALKPALDRYCGKNAATT